jgi:hypothetical protein
MNCFFFQFYSLSIFIFHFSFGYHFFYCNLFYFGWFLEMNFFFYNFILHYIYISYFIFILFIAIVLTLTSFLNWFFLFHTSTLDWVSWLTPNLGFNRLQILGINLSLRDSPSSSDVVFFKKNSCFLISLFEIWFNGIYIYSIFHSFWKDHGSFYI